MHPWFFSFLIFMLIFCLSFLINFSFFISFSLPDPAAAKSLAIPLIPRQSALFGVIEISITFKEFLEK